MLNMNIIKKLVRFLQDHDIGFSYSNRSYAQESEDMILRYIFSGQSTGFYLDIGAHHSKRFSNTYFFISRH